MTTRGFRTNWRRAKAGYRNATGGHKTAARKRLVKLVADELRRENTPNSTLMVGRV